jgi:large subunit ribosomal protein L9
MKVIFLQDIPRVAQAGEVKEVADGYARNFLIPQKLAVMANPSTLNTLEAQIKKAASSQAQTEEEMTDLAHQLDGKEITLKAKVGAKEQLYGSITSADIAAELQNNGLVVDKKKIEIAEPIRKLGSHEVAIRLAKDATPKIKVIVIEEETSQSDQ